MGTFKITEKLKSLRESHGIKPEEIAKTLKITPEAYNKFETGESEVTFKRLQEIAKFYKMSVHDIFNADNKQEINQNNNQHQGDEDAVKSLNNIFGDNIIQNAVSENERELYQQQIKQLQEEVRFLKELLGNAKKNN